MSRSAHEETEELNLPNSEDASWKVVAMFRLLQQFYITRAYGTRSLSPVQLIGCSGDRIQVATFPPLARSFSCPLFELGFKIRISSSISSYTIVPLSKYFRLTVPLRNYIATHARMVFPWQHHWVMRIYEDYQMHINLISVRLITGNKSNT